MKRSYAITLIIIFFISIVLRFWRLGDVPAGFDADEAAFGYNTYSIIQTGSDEYGKFLPIALQSFGEYKPAFYTYLSIPTVFLFDLTAFSVRFPSALFGSLSVLILYFFSKKLLHNRRLALISAFLLAISPWHINLSRTTSEVIVALFFILLLCYGLLSLIEAKGKNMKWLFVASLVGILAIFSYTAAIFFVVFVTILFFVYSLRRHDKKIVYNRSILFLIGLFLICGFLYSLLGSINRFKQVNIFQHPETRLILEEQLREDQFTNPLISRFFHNKVINTTRTILKNYNEYFTLDYLVLNGGYPYRERVNATGLFYIWEIPFLLLGFIVLIRKYQKIGIFLAAWWLLFILPAVITFDEIPNVYRSLIILPALILVIATGLEQLLAYKSIFMKIIFIGIVLIGVWEFFYYEHQYFIHQEVHHPWYRGYPYQELTRDVKKLYSTYHTIVITKAQSSPYIYFLFYNKYDPKKYQQEGSPRDLHYTGFDKYRFTGIDCPLHGGKTKKDNVTGEPGVLYVNKGTCPVPAHSVKIVKVINWQDNNPAFTLLEYIKQ